ncbi:hypothetical protein FY034_17210 (plasmid) [Trichlorobacter lovleyi]|uniref:hypothetical protein n=1 Tax=Trichlorobacter lovleyi TaxID=313985 RepID=UPI00223F3CA4|nr:hypothetical protein [Trichlorobacter lovleyi]QOX80762.1 hypothetical protein FY034_17210 [Trichlorobacter lovleyi]
MLTAAILSVFLGLLIVLAITYAIEPKPAKNSDQDIFYLRRLDLFPEFLEEWEQSVDKKILVAPRGIAIPVINGAPALLSDHFYESKAFQDEWEAAEAYAAACACEVGCQDVWEYWEGKGGWDEEH